MSPKRAKKLLEAAAATRSALIEEGGRPVRFKGAGPRLMRKKSGMHYEAALNGGEGFNLVNGDEIMAIAAGGKR